MEKIPAHSICSSNIATYVSHLLSQAFIFLSVKRENVVSKTCADSRVPGEQHREASLDEDRPVVLNRGDFTPQEDIPQHLKTFFTSVTTKVGERLGDAADIQWVEDKDTAKQPARQRAVLTQQRILQPSMAIALRLKNPVRGLLMGNIDYIQSKFDFTTL